MSAATYLLLALAFLTALLCLAEHLAYISPPIGREPRHRAK